MTKKKAAPKAYTASIKVLGKVYSASGASVAEAITNLKPNGVAKGVSILTLKHGDKSKDRVLPPNATFRLFSASPLMREIALKNTTALFGGFDL